MAHDAFTFVPMRPEHLPLMRHWLEQPHWREWWGDVDEEIAYVTDMIAGRDSTEPYLIIHDEAPIGYHGQQYSALLSTIFKGRAAVPQRRYVRHVSGRP